MGTPLTPKYTPYTSIDPLGSNAHIYMYYSANLQEALRSAQHGRNSISFSIMEIDHGNLHKITN